VYKSMKTDIEFDSGWQEDLLNGKCMIKYGKCLIKFEKIFQQGFVELEDFERRFTRNSDERYQKLVLPSFITNEYDYSPPVYVGVDLPGFDESEYSNFNLEAMVRKAF
jgi:hypothetical protein